VIRSSIYQLAGQLAKKTAIWMKLCNTQMGACIGKKSGTGNKFSNKKSGLQKQSRFFVNQR